VRLGCIWLVWCGCVVLGWFSEAGLYWVGLVRLGFIRLD